MIRSKDELMASIKERFGDNVEDETLKLIEDVSDTFSDLESKASDTTNWKQKYEDNDKEWRNKYKERFFSSNNDEDNKPKDDEDKPITSFEQLFKIKEA